LFERGVKTAWSWAEPGHFVRWFSDGERRYGKQLWSAASVWLKPLEGTVEYRYRKVWREGVEVAMKVKASQGRQRIEWVKVEHPWTAISPEYDVHANHNEANNSALRRRCSAYRRRQNLYAKTSAGLHRAVTVQQLVHNWTRPHWGLNKDTTPAMAMQFYHRPISMTELLSLRGFDALPN
jgi:hypothetical protein